MKILALSNLYPPDVLGGYELACRQAVDALRARGHEVLVLTSAPRQPVPHEPHVSRSLKLTDVWEPYYSYYIQRTRPVTHDLYQAEAHFVNAYNVHRLIETLEDFRPDAAYIWNLVGLGGLGLLGGLKHLQVPWVWELQDCVPPILCKTFAWWEGPVPALAREFERHVRGHYQVMSRRIVEEIEAQGMKLQGTVELLPGWIQGHRPPDRATHFARGGHLRIVSSGQLGRHKGTDVTIEAAGLLRAAGFENFSVDFYGRAIEQHYQGLIHKLGLDGHVRLRGPIPQAELLRRYGDYDLLAFPTWEREPFGLVPLEAAAYGCVPVITRSCGVGEWLVHGVHCLKADRTAEAFAEVFRGVLDGEVDLEPLGRRGAAAAWRDFHIDAIAQRIERALEEASRSPRDGAGTAEEAYRLALLAEKLTQILISEKACA